MKQYYTININGQKAVDAGYDFCGSHCYAQLMNGGKSIAQMEVVIDEDGYYNGFPNKWVSVSYIYDGKDVETALDILKGCGFEGCSCIISLDIESGCFAKQAEMCCMVI